MGKIESTGPLEKQDFKNSRKKLHNHFLHHYPMCAGWSNYKSVNKPIWSTLFWCTSTLPRIWPSLGFKIIPPYLHTDANVGGNFCTLLVIGVPYTTVLCTVQYILYNLQVNVNKPLVYHCVEYQDLLAGSGCEPAILCSTTFIPPPPLPSPLAGHKLTLFDRHVGRAHFLGNLTSFFFGRV